MATVDGLVPNQEAEPIILFLHHEDLQKEMSGGTNYIGAVQSYLSVQNTQFANENAIEPGGDLTKATEATETENKSADPAGKPQQVIDVAEDPEEMVYAPEFLTTDFVVQEEETSGSAFNGLIASFQKTNEATTNDVVEVRFACDLCYFDSADLPTLERHKASQHPNDKPFRCKLCHFTTSKKFALTRHESVHTSVPVKCNICNFTAREKWRMNAHMKKHDAPQPRRIKAYFECDECQFTCEKLAALNRHKAEHTLPRSQPALNCQQEVNVPRPPPFRRTVPFKCDACEFTTVLHQTLIKHVLVHSSVCQCRKGHLVDEPLLACDQCPYTTLCKTSLMKHRDWHSWHKLFRCDQCEFASLDLSLYERHKLTHTIEEIFQCEHCSFSSEYPQRLKNHLLVEHNIIVDDTLRPTPVHLPTITLPTKPPQNPKPTTVTPRPLKPKTIVPGSSILKNKLQNGNDNISQPVAIPVPSTSEGESILPVDACYDEEQNSKGAVQSIELSPVKEELKDDCEVVYVAPKLTGRPSILSNTVPRTAAPASNFNCPVMPKPCLFNCKMCKFSCRYLFELANHELTHANSAKAYRCDACNFSTNIIASLEKHLLKHGSETFKCRECGYSCRDAIALRSHKLTHGKAAIIPERDRNQLPCKKQKPNIDKEFKCNLCRYFAHGEANLMVHVNTCHSQKPVAITSSSVEYSDDTQLGEYNLFDYELRYYSGDTTTFSNALVGASGPIKSKRSVTRKKSGVTKAKQDTSSSKKILQQLRSLTKSCFVKIERLSGEKMAALSEGTFRSPETTEFNQPNKVPNNTPASSSLSNSSLSGNEILNVSSTLDPPMENTVVSPVYSNNSDPSVMQDIPSTLFISSVYSLAGQESSEVDPSVHWDCVESNPDQTNVNQEPLPPPLFEAPTDNIASSVSDTVLNEEPCLETAQEIDTNKSDLINADTVKNSESENLTPSVPSDSHDKESNMDSLKVEEWQTKEEHATPFHDISNRGIRVLGQESVIPQNQAQLESSESKLMEPKPETSSPEKGDEPAQSESYETDIVGPNIEPIPLDMGEESFTMDSDNGALALSSDSSDSQVALQTTPPQASEESDVIPNASSQQSPELLFQELPPLSHQTETEVELVHPTSVETDVARPKREHPKRLRSSKSYLSYRNSGIKRKLENEISLTPPVNSRAGLKRGRPKKLERRKSSKELVGKSRSFVVKPIRPKDRLDEIGQLIEEVIQRYSAEMEDAVVNKETKSTYLHNKQDANDKTERLAGASNIDDGLLDNSLENISSITKTVESPVKRKARKPSKTLFAIPSREVTEIMPNPIEMDYQFLTKPCFVRITRLHFEPIEQSSLSNKGKKKKSRTVKATTLKDAVLAKVYGGVRKREILTKSPKEKYKYKCKKSPKVTKSSLKT